VFERKERISFSLSDMARFTPLASCERIMAMVAAVPPSIARAPFHSTHGTFFLILIFNHVGSGKKGSETKGLNWQWFSPVLDGYRNFMIPMGPAFTK
jgi:hypothetical protein